MGFALRSFLLSEGIRCVSGAERPTYRLTRRCSRRRIRWAGPAGRGFWAFTLPGVPGDRRGVSATATGCSLGLYPSRVCRRKPGPGSHPDSSHALSRASALQPGPDGASECRSVFAWPHPVTRRSGCPRDATLLGFSHRHAPEHLSRPAVRAIGSPCAAPYITADSRRALDSLPRSTRAARETPGVPSISRPHVAILTITQDLCLVKEIGVLLHFDSLSRATYG